MMYSKFISKEVYIVTGPDDEETSDFFITEDWDTMIAVVEEKNLATDMETRVFHGLLGSAEYLPGNLKGKSAFVVVIDPLDSKKGAVVECDATNMEEVAANIESLLDMSARTSLDDLSIDDLFILYGYQLITCLSVKKDSVDEEVIASCREITDTIKAVETLAKITLENR